MITITAGLLLFCIILTLHPLIILIHSLWQIACNSNPIDLKRTFGDWAVVTGSTDGIGKEYAKELAKKDINIVLISRCLDKLKATKNEIHLLNTNIQIEIIQADFSKNRNEIEKIADKLKDIPVGILVNNVGKLTEYPMYFGEHSRTDLWDIININIAAATLMTHLVIEKMKKKRRGAIVNVSSGIDTIPMPLMSIYASSKTFIRFFSEAIRAEYSKYGLTIQTLAPYYIDTKMVSFVDGIKTQQPMLKVL
ncbi:hydroxysteroid dehydrogenase-like protein 1 isoform X2 [Phymastichus coffea]|uniref:hydroxysteroid dehydrogenase-like protein 1 isoform X2 n=1 Tax=Phymastichus coffea TaxID=108790 RepID=UPI00273B7B9C|nr:hydroxysteroid dehydrogenase-like protein 1 isoform X2 [Phymastichus coffea]